MQEEKEEKPEGNYVVAPPERGEGGVAVLLGKQPPPVAINQECSAERSMDCARGNLSARLDCHCIHCLPAKGKSRILHADHSEDFGNCG
ncbi:hypothetical protein AVEN_98944-1 [Araneus ventricosus]|uniref:Uncharacterized protein n=1 Tax=Araneus ventricosus TaxID=182803 RepID=A0A4Y2F4C7_ARAVE|nr:hypothetical protein AVEN_98944-1 [Araneus ventricosus]